MTTNDTRWGDQIAAERIHGIPYLMYTERPRHVARLLDYAAAWGRRLHVIHGDEGISFEDLGHAVAKKSGQLLAAGVRQGDHVMLLGWNSAAWVVNFWACLRVGAIPVLANAWWSPAEVANAITLTSPVLALADEHAAARLPAQVRVGAWGIDLHAAPANQAPPCPQADESATALIIFTSGTSGQPKAVLLSHRALLARLQMTLHVTRKLPHQIDPSAHDITLITGPLFHVGGMQTLLRALIVGDTLAFTRGRYDPAEVLALIELQKIKRWNAVPTMVSRLLNHADLPTRDLSSLKSISIGGAPVHAELMQRIRTKLPGVNPRIPTGYGLTENGGQATAAAGSESLDRLGSCGRPLPCVEVSFLAHPGLPDGEVLLRSPTQMSGYLGVSESPIDADGWLHTGDLGRLDETGNLWITGRCKDMIIRGGENIAPAAVERALMAIAGVLEAVVFGLPHPDLGEEVMAVVVLDRELSAKQLSEQLRGSLASFAIPSRWRLQTERLPTNDTGKVDKAWLAMQAKADAPPESQPSPGP